MADGALSPTLCQRKRPRAMWLGSAATLTPMTDHDAELDAIVAMLSEAGLVDQDTNEDGQEALRLSPRGAQLGRAMAMGGEDAEA